MCCMIPTALRCYISNHNKLHKAIFTGYDGSLSVSLKLDTFR